LRVSALAKWIYLLGLNNKQESYRMILPFYSGVALASAQKNVCRFRKDSVSIRGAEEMDLILCLHALVRIKKL